MENVKHIEASQITANFDSNIFWPCIRSRLSFQSLPFRISNIQVRSLMDSETRCTCSSPRYFRSFSQLLQHCRINSKSQIQNGHLLTFILQLKNFNISNYTNNYQTTHHNILNTWLDGQVLDSIVWKDTSFIFYFLLNPNM